jgi:hypothetical protein
MNGARSEIASEPMRDWTPDGEQTVLTREQEGAVRQLDAWLHGWAVMMPKVYSSAGRSIVLATVARLDADRRAA